VSADAVTSSELHHVQSLSSLQLEADCASSLVPLTENSVNSSAELAAKPLPTVDGAKEMSVTDGRGKPRSGNLSIVSEESGLKSLPQGCLFIAYYYCYYYYYY